MKTAWGHSYCHQRGRSHAQRLLKGLRPRWTIALRIHAAKTTSLYAVAAAARGDGLEGCEAGKVALCYCGRSRAGCMLDEMMVVR